MSDQDREQGWPSEACEPEALPREVEPPEALEDAVTAAVFSRGGIRAGAGEARTARRGIPVGWSIAASVALLLLGFAAGRRTGIEPPSPTGAPQTADYALLLFETDGFDRATGPERLTRYGEYSRWVAEARTRGQFVAGEDLEVERGWVMRPSADGRLATPGVRPNEASALSGIFFITAESDDHALALAESLPHLRHGGQVVVQRTVPTDAPPSTDP